MSAAAWIDGVVWGFERCGAAVRFDTTFDDGIVVCDATDDEGLSADARGVRATGGGCVRGDGAREVEGADRASVPVGGGGAGASRSGSAEDYGEGFADSLSRHLCSIVNISVIEHFGKMSGIVRRDDRDDSHALRIGKPV